MVVEFKNTPLTCRELLLAFAATGNDEQHDRFDAMFELISRRAVNLTYDELLDMDLDSVMGMLATMTKASADAVATLASSARVRDMIRTLSKEIEKDKDKG